MANLWRSDKNLLSGSGCVITREIVQILFTSLGEEGHNIGEQGLIKVDSNY
jgi:hypothetical protein